MITYRVYTENLNLTKIKEFANQVSDCFTIYHTLGCYKNNPEESLVIEFIVAGGLDGAIALCAERIKEYNNQSCVLVTKTNCEVEYIY